MTSVNTGLLNPATGESLPEQKPHDKAEVQLRVAQSYAAFAGWRTREFAARAESVLRLSQLMADQKEALARLMTTEMGKAIRESISEVEKCVNSCRVLVEHFPTWRSHHESVASHGFSVSREPLGVVMGIMPWNFPLWQVIRFAVPTLLCGNTVLLKHAPNTWGTARKLEDLFREAFPTSVYLDLRADVEMMPTLIGDPRIRGVSLTGSPRAGSSAGALAGQFIKKCVLELGGSDAYVILDDADIEKAAQICTTSRLINAGQSCVSAKRFIVSRPKYKNFVESMVSEMKKKKVGDPLETSTDIGPLARVDLLEQLKKQVTDSVNRGAQIAFATKDIPSNGCYYAPTVLTDVKPGMPAFDEELFGPVAAIIEAESETHALELANQSRYGLGGAIFSRNVARARELARTSMDAGMVFINDFVKSDALAPFGGVKDSGIGRELGRDGCFEFTNIKSIYVGK
jgi:succinate-semialdehyde dehydrogenase/glutarate-semialdehyde dehydrogenase